MPYVPHDRFQDYFDKLNAHEVQEYMRNLLIALQHVHSFGVIHRDVKPSNFLHDRKTQKYLLVDFGLAQSLKDLDSTKPTKEKDVVDGGVRSNVVKDDNNDCDTSTKTNEQQQHKQQQQPATNDNSIGTATCNTTTTTPETLATTSTTEQSMANTGNIKRKATEIEETENMVNSAKRLRIGARHLDDDANNIANSPGISVSHPISASPHIPCKSPLKQVNEISTPKGRGLAIDSPLTRQIKSAVLSYSINSKMAQQLQKSNPIGEAAETAPSATTTASNTNESNNNDSKCATTVAPPGPTGATPNAHKYTVDNRRRGSSGGVVKCFCYGKPTVCNSCIIKKDINAPRAGTPGYRPSEVLLKYPNQTTAVDVWAAGVILISILSGCYPFFKGTDDFQALAEIITVFGDDVVKKTAFSLGRYITYSRQKKPLHLRKLCIRLRNRCKIPIENTPFTDSTKIDKCDNCEQMAVDCLCQHSNLNTDFSDDIYPDSVYDLLAKLMAINPNNRISASDALDHPFFKENL